MTPGRLPFLFIFALLTGCSQPSAQPDGDSTSADEETTSGGCDLTLRTRINDADAGTLSASAPVTLKAEVYNPGDAAITLSVNDGCPGGAANFNAEPRTGLDYYSTCTAGACMPERPPATIEVPAGGWATVSTTTVERQDGCHMDVAPGTYALSFGLSFTDEAGEALELCEEPATLTIE